MGSWDETCALTNRAIQCGDEVVAVSVNPPKYTIDKYYQIDGRQIKSIVRGKYDDYGWVEGSSENPDAETVFMFHAAAWDAVVGSDLMRDSYKSLEHLIRDNIRHCTDMITLRNSILEYEPLSQNIHGDYWEQEISKWNLPYLVELMIIVNYCFMIRKPFRFLLLARSLRKTVFRSKSFTESS